jgi:hypothetical protein
MLDLDRLFRLDLFRKSVYKSLNYLKSVVWWSAHPRCMIMLYRGLVRSVLEYGSVCYSRMARNHMLRLERVYYQGIRITLGLNSEQYTGGLQWHGTSSGKICIPECIAGYSDVLPLNIVSSGSFTQHDFSALLAMSDHMESALSGVLTSMYSVVAPRELVTMTSRYAVCCSMVFDTDGSLIDRCTGFAFHRAEESGFGYKISSPAGIFTVELTALFVTLRHIGVVIQPPEKCLSSVKTLLSRKISH